MMKEIFAVSKKFGFKLDKSHNDEHWPMGNEFELSRPRKWSPGFADQSQVVIRNASHVMLEDNRDHFSGIHGNICDLTVAWSIAPVRIVGLNSPMDCIIDQAMSLVVVTRQNVYFVTETDAHQGHQVGIGVLLAP